MFTSHHAIHLLQTHKQVAQSNLPQKCNCLKFRAPLPDVPIVPDKLGASFVNPSGLRSPAGVYVRHGQSRLQCRSPTGINVLLCGVMDMW
jgi:hypothetical protein